MTIRVSRPMDYADRFGIQQADQAIKKDIIRALVELVTNSDDSYRRIESTGTDVDGRIIIELQRGRRNNSVLRIIDFAEGMNSQTMDHALGRYAEDTSGFSTGQPVRGYFGRGIKDSILGLGEGRVSGVVGGRIHLAWLGIKDRRPHYVSNEPIPAPPNFLHSLGGQPRSNASLVEITITRDDIRIPHFENLRKQLSFHFALRDILDNPKREILLRELDPNNRPRREFQLRYRFPIAEHVSTVSVPVGNSGVECEITLYKATEPLDTPREVGPSAQAGLLIKGVNAIFENTLFKFDGIVHSQRFFGRVTCPHLDQLLRDYQPIVLATRDGLDRSHTFIRELIQTCENFLQPFVDEEARRARTEERRVQSAQLRQKLSQALTELNRIAREELAALDPGNDPETPNPFVPDSGFGFVPDMTNVVLTRRKTLLIRGLTPQIVPEGSLVNVSSENPNVTIVTPSLTIEPREDFPWIAEAKVIAEGTQVGAESIIVAECEGLTAEALVRVIGREPPSEDDHPDRRRRRGGLFNEIRFSEQQNPRQRVRYDEQTQDIIVAINHSSVSPYITDSVGTGTDTAQGQVILAELVSEAVCNAIAIRGVRTGRFPAPVGGDVEAIQVQQLRLQNLYAGPIHRALVEPEFRRP